MKRTDITELFPEAPKEAIDKIMSLNGADVNAAKAEVESLRQQLEEAQRNAESSGLLAEARKQIETLTGELEGMKNAESIRLMREKIASAKKVPVGLLTGETEEACAKQADDILAFARPTDYPDVRDGGESAGLPKQSTRDQFADYMTKLMT